MHDFPNKPWSASGLDKLIKTENWPPNNPGLNPGLWITAFWKICHKACMCKHQRIRDMQHMKDLLEEKREELPPYEIDACINQFRV